MHFILKDLKDSSFKNKYETFFKLLENTFPVKTGKFLIKSTTLFTTFVDWFTPNSQPILNLKFVIEFDRGKTKQNRTFERERRYVCPRRHARSNWTGRSVLSEPQICSAGFLHSNTLRLPNT